MQMHTNIEGLILKDCIIFIFLFNEILSENSGPATAYPTVTVFA